MLTKKNKPAAPQTVTKNTTQKVGDLAVRDTFYLDGKKYKVMFKDGKCVDVGLLKTATIKDTTHTTKQIEYPIKIIRLDASTLIS